MRKKSFLDMTDLLDRRIPIAITAVFLLQAGTAIWWAASRDAEDSFVAARVTNLEQAEEKTADTQTQTLERLARIEERINAEAEALTRIENRLGTQR